MLPVSLSPSMHRCTRRETKSIIAARSKHYGDEVIRRRLRIWWHGDSKWFSGQVNQYSSSGEHLVVYEDGDVKWHDLGSEEFHGQLEWVDKRAVKRKRQSSMASSHAKPSPKLRTQDSKTSVAVVTNSASSSKAVKSRSSKTSTDDDEDKEEDDDGDSEDNSEERIRGDLRARSPLLRTARRRKMSKGSASALTARSRDADSAHALLGLSLPGTSRWLPQSVSTTDLAASAVAAVAEGAAASATCEAIAAQRHTSCRLGALAGLMLRQRMEPPQHLVGLLWQRALDCEATPMEVASALAALRAATGVQCGASGGASTRTRAESLVPELARLLRTANQNATRRVRAEAQRGQCLLAASAMCIGGVASGCSSTAEESSVAMEQPISSGEVFDADMSTIVAALGSPSSSAHAAATAMIDAIFDGEDGAPLRGALSRHFCGAYCRMTSLASQSRLLDGITGMHSELRLLTELHERCLADESPPASAWAGPVPPSRLTQLSDHFLAVRSDAAPSFLLVQSRIARAALSSASLVSGGPDTDGCRSVAAACRALALRCQAARSGDLDDASVITGLRFAGEAFEAEALRL